MQVRVQIVSGTLHSNGGNEGYIKKMDFPHLSSRFSSFQETFYLFYTFNTFTSQEQNLSDFRRLHTSRINDLKHRY